MNSASTEEHIYWPLYSPSQRPYGFNTSYSRCLACTKHSHTKQNCVCRDFDVKTRIKGRSISLPTGIFDKVVILQIFTWRPEFGWLSWHNCCLSRHFHPGRSADKTGRSVVATGRVNIRDRRPLNYDRATPVDTPVMRQIWTSEDVFVLVFAASPPTCLFARWVIVRIYHVPIVVYPNYNIGAAAPTNLRGMYTFAFDFSWIYCRFYLAKFTTFDTWIIFCHC